MAFSLQAGSRDFTVLLLKLLYLKILWEGIWLLSDPGSPLRDEAAASGRFSRQRSSSLWLPDGTWKNHTLTLREHTVWAWRPGRKDAIRVAASTPGKPGPQCMITCGWLGTGFYYKCFLLVPLAQQLERARTSSLLPQTLQWLLMALEATTPKNLPSDPPPATPGSTQSPLSWSWVFTDLDRWGRNPLSSWQKT